MSEVYNNLLQRYPEFLKYAMSLNPNDAEDAVQEAYLDAWIFQDILPSEDIDRHMKVFISNNLLQSLLHNSREIPANLTNLVVAETSNFNEEKEKLISRIVKFI